MGAPAHVHEWWLRRKCSAENTCTARWDTSAVPIALVPTAPSPQLAPSTKPSRSAFISTDGDPERHSTRPFASATTRMLSPSATSDSRPCEISSSTSISPDDRRSISSPPVSTTGTSSGTLSCIPLAISRCQESPITSRGRAGARCPAIVAS
jgi:hypothetical protein